MNIGPNSPSGGPAGGGRGKGRRRRPQGGKRSGPGQPSHRGPGGHGKGPHSRHSQQTGGGIYSAPMDHSYRSALNQSGGQAGNRSPRGGRNQQRGGGFGAAYLQPEPEPLPVQNEAAATRIFAFIDDLFFQAKIQETARKLNVKVEFVKTEKDLLERIGSNGDSKPSLIIFDLNNASAKPLSTIPKLKSKLKKQTNIIGFLSHVQGELKVKAQEAGCDMVLPRSAFSQNLPQLLRRHGAPEEPETA
jgi:hypothetical protein